MADKMGMIETMRAAGFCVLGGTVVAVGFAVIGALLGPGEVVAALLSVGGALVGAAYFLERRARRPVLDSEMD